MNWIMRFFPTKDTTLALAGVMQSLYWVHQLAAHGKTDKQHLRLSVNAIMNTNPASAADVYGGIMQLGDGILCLDQILRGRGSLSLSTMEQTLLTRYAGQVLRLGKRLRETPATLEALTLGLGQMELPDLEEADTDAALRNQVDALAKLYVVNISPMKPRLMVSGQPTYLRNDQFVADIRCHLLAAVRSAVLWHQCGGRLWQLFLLRGFWLRHLQALASELPNPTAQDSDSL